MEAVKPVRRRGWQQPPGWERLWPLGKEKGEGRGVKYLRVDGGEGGERRRGACLLAVTFVAPFVWRCEGVLRERAERAAIWSQAVGCVSPRGRTEVGVGE